MSCVKSLDSSLFVAVSASLGFSNLLKSNTDVADSVATVGPPIDRWGDG